ncbi:MAG: PhnD/SsuA/transferrin family substrate-binding protein [Actinobacteria bacterium]|nr:PhnD/SsuA/transferrin family substrate-binding protein [Actinomycetota bacterium]
MVVFILASCAQDDGDETSSAAGGKDKVNVLLAFVHGIDFVHYYLAEDLGFFDRCGLDVELKTAANVENPAQLVVGGAVDFALIDPITTISAVHRELPLVAIAQDTARTGVTYYSLKETGIESPADLPGHTIGLNPGGDNVWFLEKIMEDNLTPEQIEQVTIVPSDFSINPLLTGRVDGYSTWTTDAAVSVAEQDGFELNGLKAYDYGIRTTGNLLVTNKEHLSGDQLDLTTRFLAAVSAGLEQLTPENTEAAVDAALSRMDEAPSREAMASVYEALLDLQENPLYDENGVGWHDPFAYEQTQDFLLDNGEVSELLPVEQLYTTEVLEEIFTDGKVDLDKVCG